MLIVLMDFVILIVKPEYISTSALQKCKSQTKYRSFSIIKIRYIYDLKGILLSVVYQIEMLLYHWSKMSQTLLKLC